MNTSVVPRCVVLVEEGIADSAGQLYGMSLERVRALSQDIMGIRRDGDVTKMFLAPTKDARITANTIRSFVGNNFEKHEYPLLSRDNFRTKADMASVTNLLERTPIADVFILITNGHIVFHNLQDWMASRFGIRPFPSHVSSVPGCATIVDIEAKQIRRVDIGLVV